MEETLPLFAPPELDLRIHLAERLHSLAAQQLFFGSSSWNRRDGFAPSTRPRYGPRSINSGFLSPELLKGEFLNSLLPYQEPVSLLIREFPTLVGKAFTSLAQFSEALNKFFAALPSTFRFGVEIRSRLIKRSRNRNAECAPGTIAADRIMWIDQGGLINVD